MPIPNTHSTLDTLILSKLYQPRMHPHVLLRPHLTQQLDGETAYKVTLFSAPVGAGKTTLLSIWLEPRADAVAWISLDERDSDLSTCFTYVAAALGVNMGEQIHELSSPTPRYCARYVIDIMETRPDIQILVLDDYHTLADKSPVHQMMSALIEYLPPHVHVVIASRSDPPLPLAKWRGRSHLRELRMQDLSFTQAEVHAYLDQNVDQKIDKHTAALLHARTEGWPAIVRLAVLPLQQQRDPAVYLEALYTERSFIMDYLADEVLANVPDATAHFLLQVSILDRCSAALCAAVTDTAESHCQEILHWLATHNLFTTVIDAHGQWYRFHDLFREMLRIRLHLRLGKAQITTLHQRASAWLAQHGHVEAAMRHLLAAGNRDEAARLVEEYKHPLLNVERFHELEHLLSLLPADIINQRPALLLTQAFIYYFRGSMTTKLAETMDAVERLLAAEEQQIEEEAWRTWSGEAATLYSLLWYVRGDSARAIHCAQEALAVLPPSRTYVRGIAFLYLGAAYQMAGDLGLAVYTLQQTLVDLGANDLSIQLRIRIALMLVYLQAGEWRQLVQAAHQLLKVAETHDRPASIGWAHWVLGLVHYEWNELDAAAKHFAANIALQHRIRTDTVALSYLGQASVYTAQGQPQEATASLDTLLDSLLDNHNAELVQLLETIRARLALQQGACEPAESWARSVDGAPLPVAEVLRASTEPRVLTYCRVLLVRDTPPDLQQAAELLDACLALASAAHNVRRLIEIKSVQSLVYAAQGARDAALDILTEALELAQRGAFIRTFVDLGPPLADVLHSLLARDLLPASLCHYGQTILAAFPGAASHRSLPAADSTASSALIEPLTEREMDVLLLLDQRFSNKEIARKLVIAPVTVKKHTINIYQKLHVNNRRQAVERAYALAILPG